MNKQLQKIKSQISNLTKQKEEIEGKLIFKTPDYKRAQNSVGKFFKVKNNYPCAEKEPDYWDLYYYVKSIDIDSYNIWNDSENNNVTIGLKVDSFEIDKFGKVEIDFNRNSYFHLIGEEVKDNQEIKNVLIKIYQAGMYFYMKLKVDKE